MYQKAEAKRSRNYNLHFHVNYNDLRTNQETWKDVLAL